MFGSNTYPFHLYKKNPNHCDSDFFWQNLWITGVVLARGGLNHAAMTTVVRHSPA